MFSTCLPPLLLLPDVTSVNAEVLLSSVILIKRWD